MRLGGFYGKIIDQESHRGTWITGVSNEKTNELTIPAILFENVTILLTRTTFYISNTGKIENVLEFKMKLFEWLFHCR